MQKKIQQKQNVNKNLSQKSLFITMTTVARVRHVLLWQCVKNVKLFTASILISGDIKLHSCRQSSLLDRFTAANNVFLVSYTQDVLIPVMI